MKQHVFFMKQPIITFDKAGYFWGSNVRGGRLTSHNLIMYIRVHASNYIHPLEVQVDSTLVYDNLKKHLPGDSSRNLT